MNVVYKGLVDILVILIGGKDNWKAINISQRLKQLSFSKVDAWLYTHSHRMNEKLKCPFYCTANKV